MKTILKSILLVCGIFMIYSTNAQIGSLVSHYKFNGDAKDEQNQVDGTTSGVFLGTDRFGNENSAYEFSKDSSSFISLGDNYNFLSGTDSKFSFSFWYQWKDLSQSNMILLSKYGNTNCGEDEREFTLGINANQRLQFNFYTTPYFSQYRVIESSKDIVDTNWHHVVVNYDGAIDSNSGLDRVEIYVDNEIQDLKIIRVGGGLGDISNTSSHFGIGSALGVDGEICSPANKEYVFDGLMDDIRIFSNVISVDNIDSLFNESYCFRTEYVTVYDTVKTYQNILVYDTVTTEIYDSIAVTDTLFIDIDYLTGINDQLNEYVKLYPNPVNEYLFIQTNRFDLLDGYRIEIINTQSVTVYETYFDDSEFKIKISDLGNIGVYFVRIINTKGELIDVRKIILN